MTATAQTVEPDSELAPCAGFREVHPVIEPLFERLGELCSLPGVATQVIQIAEDPTTGSDDMLDVIEQDPAVATRLMQVVNSAYCGLRNPAADLKSAITLLGGDRVRNLALTVSLGNMFTRPTPAGEIDPIRLWDHSVCVAIVSRLIAQRARTVSPDEAYLAGLLHDLGLLFICQNLETLIPRILVRCRTGMSLPEAERQVMAFDHAHLGGYVAWRARLPERVVVAIDYHHDPIDCPESGAELTRVVSVANYLATRYGRGSIEGRRLPAPPESVLKSMGLNPTALRDFWKEIPEAVENAAVLTGR